MGVVYYSNYLVWFEVARAELLRKAGFVYRSIEEEMELRLMVAEARCRYKSPARYDDMVEVDCTITQLGSSSITFAYKVRRGKDLLAEAETMHVFTDSSGRPRRMPQTLKKALT